MAQPTSQQTFDLALQHHQAGRLEEAKQLYRQILAQEPMHLGAMHYLGVMEHQQGRNELAIDLIRQAIALSPNVPEPHNNLGLALKASGQTDEAIASYRRAILLKPNYINAFFNLGVALQDRGQLDDAIIAYREAIALKPDHAGMHYQLACALRDQKQFDEAAGLYRKVIALNPESFDAYSNLGYVLNEIGNLDEAILIFRQVIALKPNAAAVYSDLGNVLKRKGQLDEAIAAYRQSIALDPNWPMAHRNLGNALKEKGDLDEAIAAYRQAITLNPNDANFRCNLGNALRDQKRLDESIAAYRQAIALDPSLPDAQNNLGCVLMDLGKFDDAIAVYRRGLAASPSLPEAHFNLSLLLLRHRDFARGWEEYEWRLKCNDSPDAKRIFAKPQWDGSPLEGRTLLVHTEQGLGDAIQFIRYLPMITRKGGTVVLDCQTKLHRLFQTIPGGCKIAPRGEPLPHYDLRCALLSLPRIFKTTLENIPADVPYLFPDPDLTGLWRKELATSPAGLKIGLVWAGSATNKGDWARTISLDELAPLGQVRGATFYSLQKGPAAAQAKSPPSGLNLIDHMDQFSNFSDAALIANLDLIITVDTSVAHLAGALARPTWVLIPWVPDWRWMLDRQDSPWYPSMRLFRQPALGDWQSVIKRVADALAILTKDRA